MYAGDSKKKRLKFQNFFKLIYLIIKLNLYVGYFKSLVKLSNIV